MTVDRREYNSLFGLKPVSAQLLMMYEGQFFSRLYLRPPERVHKFNNSQANT